jgi:hypothetical protein
MQSLVPAARTNPSQPSPAPAAQQRLGRDLRPQAARLNVLQAMMADSPRQQRLVQCKVIASLPKGSSRDVRNTVYFNVGKKDAEQLWQMPLTAAASRAEVLGAIALEAGTLGAEIDKKVKGSWTYSSENGGQPGVETYDPIRVRFPAEYGPPIARDQLSLDYHFGSTWSGYVVSVSDTGNALAHTMRENRNAALGASEYSANHDINLHGGALAGSATADAATKIAGEGARWQCIGRNPGLVRDSTRIYTNENADGTVTEQVRYIPFNVLWKTWQASFDKAYGIADELVAKKLKAADVTITNADGEASSPVLTASSATMDVTRDVSVDAVKPLTQAALAPKALHFVYFKKSEGRVAEADDALSDQVGALRTALGTGRDVLVRGDGGYVGGQCFGFVCELGPAANLAGIDGYANVASRTLGVRYPSYREPVIEPVLAGHANSVEIGKGEQVFRNERTAIYEERVAQIVDEIRAWVDEIPESIDLAALVRDKVIPWDGDELLPDLDDVGGDDPGQYYGELVLTGAAELKAAKEKKFNDAVDAALNQIRGYQWKPVEERRRLRRDKRRELAGQYGFDPEDL